MVSDVANLAPVLVLSTGRCGSTMVSNMLNRHPEVLSVSEFFAFIGLNAFVGRRPSGARMWRLYSRPGTRSRYLEYTGPFDELLYPVGDSAARFSLGDLPPILAVALPHLTDEYHALYDECGSVVRGQPRQPPADHHRRLFEWLARRLDRKVWVERSGGSLLFASRLLRAFPDARVIHVFRDGRDTAISMSRHPPFRIMLAIAEKLRPLGIDPVDWLIALDGRERLAAWLGALVDRILRPERLRFDRVTIADYAVFWNRMIAIGHDVFGHFSADRLLNVRFEDVLAKPEPQIRRMIRFISPGLENEAWVREASAIPRSASSKFARLGSREQIAITEACRPGLERLGYPLE